MENKKNKYIAQAQYEYQIEVEANDIFEATKLVIDELKKRMLNGEEPFQEQRGSDINLRVWHEYP